MDPEILWFSLLLLLLLLWDNVHTPCRKMLEDACLLQCGIRYQHRAVVMFVCFFKIGRNANTIAQHSIPVTTKIAKGRAGECS